MSKVRFFEEVRRAWQFMNMRPSAKVSVSTEMIPFRELPQYEGFRFANAYRQSDFDGLDKVEADELAVAVRSFRSLVRKLSKEEPHSDAQIAEIERRFDRVADSVRKIILREWRQRIEELIADAERWSAENNWPARRESRTVSESLLGEYDVPCLLFYAEVRHVLLEPIARFVPSALGVVELTVLPSYSSIKIARSIDDEWELRFPLEDGSVENVWQTWNSSNFKEAVRRLKYLE
jgi:hypothetical protein